MYSRHVVLFETCILTQNSDTSSSEYLDMSPLHLDRAFFMARPLSMYCVPADVIPGLPGAHSPRCLPQHVYKWAHCQAQPGKLPGRHDCGGSRLAPGHCSASAHSHDYLGDSIFPLEKYFPTSSPLTHWTMQNGSLFSLTNTLIS